MHVKSNTVKLKPQMLFRQNSLMLKTSLYTNTFVAISTVTALSLQERPLYLPEVSISFIIYLFNGIAINSKNMPILYHNTAQHIDPNQHKKPFPVISNMLGWDQYCPYNSSLKSVNCNGSGGYGAIFGGPWGTSKPPSHELKFYKMQYFGTDTF